jgi:hypothetical protein
MKAIWLFAVLASLLCLAASVSAVQINEIRVDMPSDDTDEYVELAGQPGANLDGLWYIVIGDMPSVPRCGGIECVVDLSGLVIQADGLLVIGDSAMAGYHTYVYDAEAVLNFENSDNVTHMLVAGFTGYEDYDVDTDEDCVIDDAPWEMIIDSVALDEGKTTDCWGVDECYYGTTVVGPDGSYAPGHVYNCHGRWLIGDFELGITDTPGEPNICPPSPPDPLAVIPGTMPGITYIEFGTPAIPPIPADFFGPGSDPFEGQVALEGVPFQPVTFGNASTLFQRFDFPVMPDDPIGAEGMVEVEIVDLSLRGIDPIIVTYNGGLDPEEWFLTMELAENQVSGTLHATKTHENGGFFEAAMPVSPHLTFVREPGTERVLEELQVDMAWIDPMPFVHQVDPSLDIIAPSNGFFVPGVLEAIPGDPGSQHPLEMPFAELGAGMQWMLFPARHETVSAPVADGQSIPIRSYPNPLQRSTRVEFSLPWPDAVSIRVVDVRGGLVKYLADGRYGAGLAGVTWDGTDSRGHDVAPGVYFMVVKTSARSTVSKVTLVK